MFGLTAEKLFVVALLAAVIIGPRRLPEYAARLGALVRRATVLAAETRNRVAQESDAVDWRSLDPRQYDPRRIIREAWADAENAGAGGADAGAIAAGPDAAAVAAGPEAAAVGEAESGLEAPSDEAPAGRWIVSGTSAHPRRVWVPAES
jgi:sec-independent protein translocase protein TatB